MSAGMPFWFVKVIPNNLNSSTIFSIFILWLRPIFWSLDMNMYLVLSAFTSSPITLVATIKGSAFFFTVCTLPQNILTSLAQTRSRRVPFNFKPSWFTWTLLMMYSKANLKAMVIVHLLVSNHFWLETCQQILAYLNSAKWSSQTHFHSPYQFHGDTNLRLLYKTSLLTES